MILFCNRLQGLISTLTLFLLASGILMPSGSLFGFNIKILLSILILILITMQILLDGKLNLFLLSIILYFGLFISLTSVVSLLNNVPIDSLTSEMSALLSTILPILFGRYVLNKKYCTKYFMIYFLIFIISIYSIAKITVIISIYIGYFSIFDYIELIKMIFGVQPIYLETDSLVRLNEASDYIIPWAILILIRNQLQYKLLNFILICIFISAIIISYSRYLWLYSFLVVVIYYLIPKHNLLIAINIKKITREIFLFFTIIVSAIFVIPWLEIFNVLEERFFGKYADMSDLPREWMLNSLLIRISESPLIGGGMGSYDVDYIRFDNTPWNYELQWLALTANFGILFDVVVLLILGIWIANVLNRKYLLRSDKYILITLAIGWLFVGFFNCFLLNSAAGVINFAIFILGINIHKVYASVKKY